jgi:hypothetical protein
MPTSEDKFIAAARGGEFQVANWEAITGIGCFDATYSVQANQLDITFKVFVDFSDHDQPWREDEKLKWQQRAFRIVSDFWSDRFSFQCTRRGWGKYNVAVKVHVVPSPLGSAHLNLRVSKLPDDWPTSGGGVGWGQKPALCMLDNKAIEPKDQRSLRENIFNLRIYQMEQGLRDRKIGFIPFDKNSASLSSDAKAKILSYARYVHRISTKDITGIQLVVYGSTGGADSVFQTGLGKRRAKAVSDIFNCVLRDETSLLTTDSPSRKKGLKEAILRTMTDHAGNNVTSTSIQGVCIVVRVPKDVDHAAEMNYIVLCHEFGHMLGLPDEYMGRLHPKLTERVNADNIISSTLHLATKGGDPTQWGEADQRKAGQQAGMSALLDYNRDVKSPTFMDQNQVIGSTQVGSNSIMFGGMEVMPAHYLTIWACLAEMTWKYLKPTDWKIVPTPNNRGATRYF